MHDCLRYGESLSLSLSLSLSPPPLSSQVSHTVTGTALNEAHSFYRTLPSSQSANIGRLVLIARNKWFRIASINSNETYYAKVCTTTVRNALHCV